MAEHPKRDVDRDPAEEPEHGAAAYGAVLSPTGTVLAVPPALGHERSRPEPEERWTLGPRRADETGADGKPPGTAQEQEGSTP